MSATQPIRNTNQVRELAEYFLKRGKLRDHLLIVAGVHTALRIGDLLRLKWDDVYDFDRKRIRESVTITETKTGKPKTVAINKAIAAALMTYIAFAKRGDFLIKSRKGNNKAISRVQAFRIITDAAEALGFQNQVSCHSLRKTFGYLAWTNDVSLAVIMEIYNHSNFAVTRRYLGITQDDKDEVYRKLADVI